MNSLFTPCEAHSSGQKEPASICGPAGDAAGRNYWNSTWEKLPPVSTYDGPTYEYHSVLSRFLSNSGGGDAVEIGCATGNHMIYINKEFGYRVDGIDYSDNMEYVRANLAFNGVFNAKLFRQDFFEFTPPQQYDLVLSGGFAEHFDDYELVIRKHADWATPGGLVVIVVPNLTHIHKLLCGWFAPEILRVHRFPVMQRNVMRKTLEKTGLRILHCEYHMTFRPTYQLPRTMDLVARGAGKLLRISGLADIGNRFGSPYLISVSRKD
jgi:SAM-dependent methyltransferase